MTAKYDVSGVRVPLLTPSPSLLRAKAVWVTIANWAEGLATYFGQADVIAGEVVYPAVSVRPTIATGSSATVSSPPKWRTSRPALIGEALLKDWRWYRAGSRRQHTEIDHSLYADAPFVWQHHDLFHTSGRDLANRLRLPLVQFVDAPYVWESRKWGVRRPGWEGLTVHWGDRLPLLQADLVCAVSADVANAVIDLGIKESNVIVTPCTADPSLFTRDRRDALRSGFGLEGSFVIGWVGSFRAFHALDLLADAFVSLSARVSNARLLLVGDGPEAPALRQQFREKGLEDKVTWTGAVAHLDVGPLISAMDVAILPSYPGDFHYSPLKLREYFASGVPVVAGSTGEVADVIERSNGGVVVDAGNSDSICKAILELWEDEGEVREMGQRARVYAEHEMGIVPQIEAVLDALRGTR